MYINNITQLTTNTNISIAQPVLDWEFKVYLPFVEKQNIKRPIQE